jgi:hypothetical protein
LDGSAESLNAEAEAIVRLWIGSATSNFGLCVSGLIVAATTWSAGVGHAHAGERLRLTDVQLDTTTAGVTFAVAIGDGAAQGAHTSGQVVVTTMVGLGNEANTIARGQVTSVASSSSQDLGATASASLTLRVIIP